MDAKTIVSQGKDFLLSFESIKKIDWDFKEADTQYLTHRFHSYPARFIPQIPQTFIKHFTNEDDIVLDPFCGCGTTLVEAMLLKRNSIGNDLNPLAHLISKTKTTPIEKEDLLYLNYFVTKMEADAKKIDAIQTNLTKLPNRKTSSQFTPKMLAEINFIKTKIEVLKEKKEVYDLARIALSSTIRAVIESENGQNIYGVFKKKTNFMVAILEKFNELVEEKYKPKLILGDSRKLNLPSDTVDLIVTSPPYVNALDYYRVHTYNMHWLGMDYYGFKKNEIGGHSHFMFNRFRLLSEYLGDMTRSMIEMNRILKKGRICAIVIGNSSVEYELIKSYQHFINIGNKIGFEEKATIFRNIDKSSKYFSEGKIDDEYIVILHKNKDPPASSMDDEFVYDIVKYEMQKFYGTVKETQGSSLRGKKVPKERLQKNIVKLEEAMKKIPEDIKINGV